MPRSAATKVGQALAASVGGAPKHPNWYYNLKAEPASVMLQDGAEPFDVTVREVSGDERATWFERAVAVYPLYANYQARTSRNPRKPWPAIAGLGAS